MKEKKIYLKPTIKTLEIDVSCSLLAGSGETYPREDNNENPEEIESKVNFHFLDNDGSW